MQTFGTDIEKSSAISERSRGNSLTIYNIMFPQGTIITQGGAKSCAAGGFCGYRGTTEVYYIVAPNNEAGLWL